ncbi:MAG TPA: hypothetical protein VF147_04825 [Vicinamibacterales bacterium]
MRRTGFIVLVALALATAASAQTKVSGKAHCAKADPDHAVEVGDAPGHMLTLRKAACTWGEGMEIAGMKATSGQDVATAEVTGAAMRDNGYHTATMDNGDRFTVRFSGSAKMNKDNTGTFDGKWTFVSGTGKLKGIKGGGTYKGTAAADGSSDVAVDGDYTMPAKTTPTAKAPGDKK